MKKYILGTVFSLVLLASPTPTLAASLTKIQIKTLLSILSSFGADSTTIANVRTVLNGDTPPADPNVVSATGNTDIKASSDYSFLITIPDLKGANTLIAGQSYRVYWKAGKNNYTDVYDVYLNYMKGSGTDRTHVGNANQYADSFVLTVPVGIKEGTYALTFLGRGNVGGSSQMFSVVTAANTTTQKPIITNTSTELAGAGNLEMYAGGIASIYGSNLDNGRSIFWVSFGETSANVTYKSANQINIIVPSWLAVGQTYDLSVTNGNGTSNVLRVKILGKLDTANPSITVLSPNGGEIWMAGETHDLKLHTSDSSIGAAYYLMDLNGNKNRIVNSGLSNLGGGIFNSPWKIPTTLSPGQYTIILGGPLGGFPEYDRSDAPFSIVATPTVATATPHITAISPSQITSGTATGITLYGSNFNKTLMVGLTGPGADTSVSPVNVSSDGTSMQFLFPAAITVPGTYSVQVLNYGVQTYSSININVVAPAAATISMTVIGTALSWSTSNATSCQYRVNNGTWMNVTPLNGTLSLVGIGLTAGTTYTVEANCLNSGGIRGLTNQLNYTPSVVMNSNGGFSQTASVLDAFSSAMNSSATQNTVGFYTAGFYYVWNNDLQIGSLYFEDVSALQRALARDGVYTGEITGGFHNQTYIAVKKFQQKYGIKESGYVGTQTRAKLNSLYSN